MVQKLETPAFIEKARFITIELLLCCRCCANSCLSQLLFFVSKLLRQVSSFNAEEESIRNGKKINQSKEEQREMTHLRLLLLLLLVEEFE